MAKNKNVDREMSLSEVKDILDKEEEEDLNMRYEKKMALEHARTFAHISAKEAQALTKELLSIERMKAIHAIKLVEIMPADPNEVRAVFAKERFDLDEDDVKKILDLMSQYRED